MGSMRNTPEEALPCSPPGEGLCTNADLGEASLAASLLRGREVASQQLSEFEGLLCSAISVS